LSFSLNDRPFDRAAYEQLSDRVREMIAKSPEYQRANAGKPPQDDDNDPPPASGEHEYGVEEIPF
jgi:hypothetical protein